MSVEAELGIPGPSRLDKGKGIATHIRHASIDENLLSSEHPRASSSSFPSSSIPKRRPLANATARHHYPDERRSSETVFSHLSSQSASSMGANSQPPATPLEASSSTKLDREGEYPSVEDENGTIRVKERSRKHHHRRLSSKRHASPGRSSNSLEYMAQSPEDPARVPIHRHPFNGNEGIHSRFPPIQTLPGNFPNGYGSPEMPFAVPDPPLPPVFVPSPMQASFPPQLPVPNYQLTGRPFSGYELLAAKLSSNIVGPRLAPIYRRFEFLHHRLLLHMQDELIELEEQLRNLDAADTQIRTYQGGVFPASRRQESMSPTDASWKKKEIINHIAQKLYQYNQVITSFNATHGLAEPSIQDVYSYKSYLATAAPLVEDESQFLEASDDLVNLARRRRRSNGNPSDDPLSPMPQSSSVVGFPPPPSSQISNAGSSSHPAQNNTQPSLRRLVLAMAAIILAPIVCFSVIPGFVGRMTVVLLMGLGGAIGLLQSGLFNLVAEDRSTLDWVLCAGVYGGVMAVIAGII
ncbi:hypothetical protein TARUN_4463 [Trichoderma arundinaceum]|uniref:DUF6594 domain-containing protein n=1 Tax=Trichoderma arundinaceum TaxID=490622 RepID=A0A395NNT6_TRIAR|nr:hypothetical protein TARUN_4463 [Trichoderma arundinaceum]